MEALDAIKIREKTLGRKIRHSGSMYIGNWLLNIYAGRKYYADILGRLFEGKPNEQSLQKKSRINGCIYLVDCKENHEAFPMLFDHSLTVSDDSVVSWEPLSGSIWTLSTGLFRVILYRDGSSPIILIFVREPQRSLRVFSGHLSVVIHKILFKFGRFYVHSSAVKYRNKVSVFIGGKSAGKSTVSSWLGRMGGQVIADDHAFLQEDKGKFFISGSGVIAKVSEKTEKYVFNNKLKIKPRRYAGILKKSFLVKDFFKFSPNQNFLINFIFFLHVGKKFKITRISQKNATLRLIEETKLLFRFSHQEDLQDYLEYFLQLAKKVKIFDLELSPNLKNLQNLTTFLKNEKTL